MIRRNLCLRGLYPRPSEWSWTILCHGLSLSLYLCVGILFLRSLALFLMWLDVLSSSHSIRVKVVLGQLGISIYFGSRDLFTFEWLACSVASSFHFTLFFFVRNWSLTAWLFWLYRPRGLFRAHAVPNHSAQSRCVLRYDLRMCIECRGKSFIK